MAKDITIRVTGQNPDGTLNVQQLDGGNPFMSGQQNASMVPYTGGTPAPQQQGGYRATINGIVRMRGRKNGQPVNPLDLVRG